MKTTGIIFIVLAVVLSAGTAMAIVEDEAAAPTPEPSTIILLSAGMVGVGALGKRIKSRKNDDNDVRDLILNKTKGGFTMTRKNFFGKSVCCIYLSICLSVIAIGGWIQTTNAEDPPTFVMSFGTQGAGDGQFNSPYGIAVDGSDNIYVSDTNNHNVQKFNNSGQFIAKWGTQGTGDGQFSYPCDITVDSSGNVYVVDRINQRIQKFTNNGQFVTKWGTQGTGDGQFSYPHGIAVDSSDNIYVADSSNNRIQKFTSNGQFITKWGTLGSDNGQFRIPSGISIDSAGNVYVADTINHRIQKFSSSGSYISQFGSYGTDNGQLHAPTGLAFDRTGNIYVADSNNHRIQKFSSSGIYQEQFGRLGSVNGEFNYSYGVAIDSSDNIFVTDWNNHRVQKFAYQDYPPVFCSKWGSEGNGDGQFSYPADVGIDNQGYVYVVDLNNSRVQKFDRNGNFITKWGSYGDGNNQFISPWRIAVDNSGNVYVSDGTHHIRKFTSSGIFITKWGSLGSGDGQLNGPWLGMGIDKAGNVYVSDTSNNRIQKFTNNGNFLSKWGSYGTDDGQFDHPSDVHADSYGNVYVVDRQNHRIQKFDANGNFITKWGVYGSGKGQFNYPDVISIDSSDNVYVSDSGNSRIQKFSSSGNFLCEWGTQGSGDGQFIGGRADVGNDGIVYVADWANHRVQKFCYNPITIPTLTTDPVISITQSTAISGGNVTSDGGSPITEKGVCWSTSQNPTTSDSKTANGTGIGIFTSSLTGLTANTTYYVRAYAINSAGTAYGNQVSFKSTSQTYTVTFQAGSGGTVNGTITQIVNEGANCTPVTAVPNTGYQFVNWTGTGGLVSTTANPLTVSNVTANMTITANFQPIPNTAPIAFNGSLSATSGVSANGTLTATDANGDVLTYSIISQPAKGTVAANPTYPSFKYTPNAGVMGTDTFTFKANDGKADSNIATVTITINSIPIGTFIRTLPSCYIAGTTLNVTVSATPSSVTNSYAVEDTPPSGWTVSNISNGGVFDSGVNKVKFGPFFDSVKRDLTYDLTPPASESGDKSFNGKASSNGVSSDITGQTVISACQLYHPADMNQDFRIVMDELTAYGSAWKSGAAWSVPPNPIPIDYVIRAATIWKSGEAYKYDSSVGTYPLCWISTSTRSAKAFRSKTVRSESSAVRQMPAIYQAGQSITVSVAVTAASSVIAYGVEDQIPAGWTVSEIDNGGEFDNVNGKVKFGPFIDNQSRTLTYQVTPPADAKGIYTFSGTASFDGNKSEISGNNSVTDDSEPGNVDGNQTVDLGDAIKTLQVLAGLNPSNVFASADVNGDSRIGLEEVVYILQKVAGLR